MLELKHIAKTYKNGVNALYNINLKIDQGEFVYIIGPTGSGKSTLIKLLDGEEIPTKGKVEVAGINVGKLKHSKVPLYRRNIGVVFQDFRLLERKTVFENIAFALGVKAVVLAMGAFGAANMWEAVFADVGVSVIAIINAMRALRAG